MDIIGAEATGAVAQMDQPAALPQSAAAPGAKKEGAGGLFELVLARLAGDGEAGREEGKGPDQRSANGADPASLAGLLLPAAFQQSDASLSPVPTPAPAGATDAVVAAALAGENVSGQDGARAGFLPRVPPPVSLTDALLQVQTPAAQLMPGADHGGLAAGAGMQPEPENAVQPMDASGVRTRDASAVGPIVLTDGAQSFERPAPLPAAPTILPDAAPSRERSVSLAAAPTASADGASSPERPAALPVVPVPPPNAAPSPERSARTQAVFGVSMPEDAGEADSGDESGTAREILPVIMQGENGARTRFPSGRNQSSPGRQLKTGPDTVFTEGRPEPSALPLFTRPGVEQPAGGSSFADVPVAEVGVKAAVGSGESGTISIQTANLDTPRPPATGHVSFGSERLAVESLSAPATLPPASVPAPAMPRDVAAIHDPAPVAGSAFQRDTLQIQLAPTELGRITMQVSVHARQVQAAVSVEHQGLGAYLVAGQGALDEAVRSHGLRVEEFRVDLLDLGAGRTGQGHDSPEFQGHQDTLPGRPESVAEPLVPAAPLSENEPADATVPQRLNVFA